MSSGRLNLKSMAMEYLYDGMELMEDIYNYDGSILLLARGNLLTDNKIRLLKQFNANNRNISVFENTYLSLLERGITLSGSLTQEYLEERSGYSELKEKTRDFLKDVELNAYISKDDADSVVADMSDKIFRIDPSLVFQCINAPNPMDEYLRVHSINVGLINGMMGKWLKLSREEIDVLVMAGLVHDVGKTKISTEILNAPRKLTVHEYEVMKLHPIYSYELLCGDERFSNDVKFAARHHHERLNGSGYPDGLTADQISLYARITAVSDIYDAMVSKRSYKEANNPFTIISQMAGKQFSELDMKMVRLFTENMPSELVEKPVLLADGSIGIIKFIIPSDLEHPLVEVNGMVRKAEHALSCVRMVFDSDEEANA